MFRISVVTLALLAALLCIHESDGRKQRPASLVNEETALVQPVDTLPDATSGVAPGAKSQPLGASLGASLSSADTSPTTRAPKGRNGKRNKNSPGLAGKKVKKNRNNPDAQGKKKGRKNQGSSAVTSAATSANPASPASSATLVTRGKKNKNPAKATSVSPVDTSAE